MSKNPDNEICKKIENFAMTNQFSWKILLDFYIVFILLLSYVVREHNIYMGFPWTSENILTSTKILGPNFR